MLKLLQWDKLDTIVNHPELVNLRELLAICHQIFIVQVVVGAWSFVPAAFRHSIGLETLGNVAVPLLGMYYTRDLDPENYRFLRMAAGYWGFGTAFGVLRSLLSLQLSAFFGLAIRTCIGVVQWLAIARLWRLLQDRQMHNVSFCLNMVVLNKREVISNKVCNKTGWGEKVGTRTLGKIAGKLANKMMTDAKFSSGLADRIAENIPEKLAMSGIASNAETQLKRGNLMVFKVTITAVDTHRLVTKKMGSERADKISKWLTFLPRRVQLELQRNMLSRFASEIMKKLPEQMASEMKSVAGVDVAVEARTMGDEAEFLFDLLEELEHASSSSNQAATHRGEDASEPITDGLTIGEDLSSMPS